jgi:glutamate N-acetyltransferase/amino-acid N-acetyltransferase
VLVASTGVIGQPLPIEPIKDNAKALADGLTYDGGNRAAYAIMTTDTFSKEVAVEFEINGTKCRLGGMAKGSGMIHPNMATTLNFITSDAAISSDMLQKALSEIVKITYNCLSVDGDTSTNDMVILLSNGKAGNPEINADSAEYEVFKQALYIVMMNLTRLLASDGEGASKLLECTVSEAPDLDTAIIVAKSIIRSPLTKCAMFGEDANWGRILCAIGYAEADFDIDKIAVELASSAGSVKVCENGAGIPFSEEEAAKVLHEKEIYINVSMGLGDVTAKAWGCDLTYDYVKINGDYRS